MLSVCLCDMLRIHTLVERRLLVVRPESMGRVGPTNGHGIFFAPRVILQMLYNWIVVVLVQL